MHSGDSSPLHPPHPHASASAVTTRTPALLLHALRAAIAGFFLSWLPVLPSRLYDADEFEHAHDAWCLFKGMLPYRDFFEHHTPWYYFFLAPFFRWFRVDQSLDSARSFLTLARGLSVALALLSLVIVVALGRAWESRRAGLVAGLLLVSQPVWFEKMVEIRPDVLALPFYVGALTALWRGLAREPDRKWFGAAGLALGGAIMCTQKMLFVLPGLTLGLGLWLLLAGPKPRARVAALAMLVAGTALPGLLTWAGFALRHGGAQFFNNNFLLNASWQQRAHEQLLKVLEGSWPMLLLSLLGCTAALYGFVRGGRRDWGTLVLFCTMAGLIAGIPVVPVAHRQYYLPIMPIACLFAAKGLLLLVDLAWERARAWLLVLALLPLLALPIRDLREGYAAGNNEQLARLRYVYDHSAPSDLVMDGWEGLGVFRPHAFYYFFVHEELVPMISRQRLAAFEADLAAGRIRPKLIALDENLVALGSPLVRFVKKNYVSNDGFLYEAKTRAR